MRVPVSLAARVRRRSRCRWRSSRRGSRSRRPRSRGSSAAASPTRTATSSCFRVGRVLEAEKHPNADRLQLTKVDVGEGEPRSIVCGAWNFGAGATVGVALPGAVLPNGLHARAAQGARRGLRRDDPRRGRGRPRHRPRRDHAARRRAEPGTPLADVLPLVDDGAARRVDRQPPRPAVGLRHRPRGRGALRPAARGHARGQSRDAVPNEPVAIEIEDFEGCPRYIGRLFDDVHDRAVAAVAAGAAARRRHAADLERRRRHELRDARARQPAARVRLRRRCAGGRIVVRRARPGERLRTLDGVERALEPDDLRDRRRRARAIALAGIMGGEETEIGDGRRRPSCSRRRTSSRTTIFRTSERLRLRTEGSNRWEKGVDPHLAEPAADLATELMLELAGATLGRPQPTCTAGCRSGRVIALPPERADALIGVETPPDDQYALLARLGFERRRRRRRRRRPGARATSRARST